MRGAAAVWWYVHFFRDPVGCLRRAHREHGPLFALGRAASWVRGERLHLLAIGPEFNRLVIGDPALFRSTGQGIRGPADSAQRRLRNGLTRMQHDQHLQQRQLVLPALQRRVVNAAYPAMAALVDELLDEWRGREALDAWLEMRKLTLRISSRVLLGRVDAARSDSLGAMIGDFLERSFSPGVWALQRDWPGTPYRALLRHAERLEGEIRALIAEKRASGEADDLMSILVAAHEEGHEWMREDDLIGQATILFGASYETTANALTWALFLLAQHPAVSDDVADELAGALDGRVPGLDDLARLPLLEAVIKESLRLFPPVPYTLRTARAATALGPYALERGDRVVVSHYMTHHLPELYAAPERFDPARWETIRPDAYEYLPFSAGPRSCVGYRFATTVMKLVLARTLQRYRLSVPSGTRIDRAVQVTLGPRRGLPMRVHAPDERPPVAFVRGDVREMVELPARG